MIWNFHRNLEPDVDFSFNKTTPIHLLISNKFKKIMSEKKTNEKQAHWPILTSLQKFAIRRSIKRPNVLFVNCKQIPHQAKIRFVSESAILLLFFDLLCCFGLNKQLAETLHFSKLLQNRRICGTVCGIQKPITNYVYSKVDLLRNPQL